MADPSKTPWTGIRSIPSSRPFRVGLLAAVLLAAGAWAPCRAWAANCTGSGGDLAYLSKVQVLVQKSQQHPGSQTVVVKRLPDGFILRKITEGERFFEDHSQGALTIAYTILPQCGGFDVRYTISNPGHKPEPFPDLRVDGLQQSQTGDIYLLNTKDYGNVQKIPNPAGATFLDQPYPTWLYSPVIVSHDSNSAFGSALLYPVLKAGYRHTVRPVLQRVGSGAKSSWSHIYHGFTEDTGVFPEGPPSTLPPGEKREFTITVRFSAPRNWLLTLFPYKEHFSSLYWANATPRPKDLRPVFVESLTYGGSLYEIDWKANPRGYRDDYRVDLEGLGRYVHDTIAEMESNGYARVMTWTISGLYNIHISDFNYPPQIMSDWLPMLLKTQDELRAYEQHGITLGYWWGRSTQIPKPVQWNPPTLVSAEYSNPDHLRFMTGELTLARKRGGREIGLDYSFEMPLHDRYRWVDDMKAMAPGVNFIHEGAGPDVMSLKLSQFYQTPHPGGQVMVAPDVLTPYLTPHRPEIWVYLGHTTQPQSLISFKTIQDLVRWGFTPVVSVYPRVAVQGLDYKLAECFDGVDNDGDGLTDWPYDPGCATAAGTSEGAVLKAVTNTGGGSPPTRKN